MKIMAYLIKYVDLRIEAGSVDFIAFLGMLGIELL